MSARYLHGRFELNWIFADVAMIFGNRRFSQVGGASRLSSHEIVTLLPRTRDPKLLRRSPRGLINVAGGRWRKTCEKKKRAVMRGTSHRQVHVRRQIGSVQCIHTFRRQRQELMPKAESGRQSLDRSVSCLCSSSSLISTISRYMQSTGSEMFRLQWCGASPQLLKTRKDERGQARPRADSSMRSRKQ